MRRIGAFAVFVLLVAGCTSSADPGPPHTGSALPSTPATTPLTTASTATGAATPTIPADVPTTGPNTNPGEKPPLEPLAATAYTAAGAKAFAVFFIKTIDWGYATMSGAYIRHYSAADCGTCRSLANDLDVARRAGHRYIGGRSKVIGTRPGSHGPFRTQVVTVDSTSFEEVTRTGKPVSADPAYPDLKYAVTLRWARGRWEVDEVAIVQ